MMLNIRKIGKHDKYSSVVVNILMRGFFLLGALWGGRVMDPVVGAYDAPLAEPFRVYCSATCKRWVDLTQRVVIRRDIINDTPQRIGYFFVCPECKGYINISSLHLARLILELVKIEDRIYYRKIRREIG